MNVLSLFDGMSCAQITLRRLGVMLFRYFASEVDKWAVKVTQANYPDTIQLGDVNNHGTWSLPPIDLMVGGSPCQGFSVAGKGKGLDDPRSKLFLKYLACLRQFKPKWFLLENVRMKKQDQAIISACLGVEPVAINSALVSAQNRHRLYWTNIPGIEQPKDKGIMLKDIVHENYHKGIDNHGQRTQILEYKIPFDKTLQILDKEVEKGKIICSNGIYYIHGCPVSFDSSASPEYLFGCLTPDRINIRQNGRRFSTGEKFYTLTAQDQHGILIEGYIRKLTPVECERLQTVPDGYTDRVSSTQRYKMLGNGFTVDVIAHILKGML